MREAKASIADRRLLAEACRRADRAEAAGRAAKQEVVTLKESIRSLREHFEERLKAAEHDRKQAMDLATALAEALRGRKP